MIKKIALLFVFLLSSCSLFKSNIPQPKREFRGVWIATVVNIDWPKNGADPWEKQKTDYLNILNFYQDLNFNAVVVQIRAAGDAFYPSQFAPWSRYLTGKEGVAPKTEQDPLKWMIREAHSRGFEFHAWLNPYRATFDLKTERLAESHDYNQHPEWMFKYGKKYYYDPGIPEVQQHLVKIMNEVVTNYDVDALHFDDYFYPYKISNEVIPDSQTFAANAHTGQSLADWRRSNIDSLVSKVQREIKLTKPWVQFGISPFGVWKNKATDPMGSDTRAGQTTYEDLYADPLLWMKEEWIDYLAPQVYWSMDLEVASYKKIVDWWANDSIRSNIYIGNAAYKIRNNADEAWNDKKELPNQLLFARNKERIQGNVFFSAKSMLNDHQDVVKYIKKKYYKFPALPPEFPYKLGAAKNAVRITNFTEEKNFYRFNFSSTGTYQFALVYTAKKTSDQNSIHPRKLIDKIYLGSHNSFTLGRWLLHKKKDLAITFLDHYGIETDPIVLNLNEINQYDTKE